MRKTHIMYFWWASEKWLRTWLIDLWMRFKIFRGRQNNQVLSVSTNSKQLLFDMKLCVTQTSVSTSWRNILLVYLSSIICVIHEGMKNSSWLTHKMFIFFFQTRYLAVTQPLNYSRRRRSKRLALYMIFIVWMLSLAITLPPILGWYEPKRREKIIEEKECGYNENKGYVVFSAMGTCLKITPLILMFIVLSLKFSRESRESW